MTLNELVSNIGVPFATDLYVPDEVVLLTCVSFALIIVVAPFNQFAPVTVNTAGTEPVLFNVSGLVVACVGVVPGTRVP